MLCDMHKHHFVNITNENYGEFEIKTFYIYFSSSKKKNASQNHGAMPPASFQFSISKIMDQIRPQQKIQGEVLSICSEKAFKGNLFIAKHF